MLMLIREDNIVAFSLRFRQGSKFTTVTHVKLWRFSIISSWWNSWTSSISLGSTNLAYFKFCSFLAEIIFEHFESVSLKMILFLLDRMYHAGSADCILIDQNLKKTKAEIHKKCNHVSYQRKLIYILDKIL